MKTKYIPETRQLTIGMGRKGVVPVKLLGMLLNESVVQNMAVKSSCWNMRLVLTLAERDALAPLNLLCMLAERLSRIPGHLAVYDPWTVGGRPVDIALALDLIGEVFRCSSVETTTSR